MKSIGDFLFGFFCGVLAIPFLIYGLGTWFEKHYGKDVVQRLVSIMRRE